MDPALSPRILLTVLLPFAGGYLFSYLLRAINAVVAPDLVADIGLGPAELGLLTAAYLGAFCLFQLPLGVLLDRYGPRRVQTVLFAVAAAGCLGFALASNFTGLFIARAIIGLGFSAGLMASYKASSLWVPLERRALANTAMMSAGALGIVVASEPTAWLVALIGWRGVFMVYAGLTLLIATMLFIVVPEDDSGRSTASYREQFGALGRILTLPLFWRVAPYLALTSGVQIGIQSLWIGPWLHDVMGLSRPEVARHLLWMAIAFMLGILSIGILADRLGRRGIQPISIMLGCHILYLIAQCVIVFQVLPLAMPAWLIASATGQVAILAYPWFATKVGGDLAGRANASINFAMFVSAFLSQYGIGLIIGLFPPTATGYEPRAYAWAFGAFLVLQLVALAWYLLAPIGRPVGSAHAQSSSG